MSDKIGTETENKNIIALQEATIGLHLALTKLSKVIGMVLTDPAIHALNAPATTPIIGESPVATMQSAAIEVQEVANIVEEAQAPTGNAELDGEGRPWVEKYHAKNKATMRSPEVKGATKWKFTRGLDQELKDEFHAAYPLNTAIPTVEPTLATTPALPGQTVVPSNLPTTPALPGATPTTPALPGQTVAEKAAALPDIKSAVHQNILNSIKSIVDLGVSWPALKEFFVNEFGAAQNGEGVTLGGLREDQYVPVDGRCTMLLNQLQTITGNEKKIYEIATVQHKDLVDTTLNAIYAEHGSTSVVTTHYSKLSVLNDQIEDVLKQWVDYANQLAGQ